MSLISRINDLATRVANEFNAVRTEFAALVHTHTANQITDFDTEVSNNSAVAANTAKVSADTVILSANGTETLTPGSETLVPIVVPSHLDGWEIIEYSIYEGINTFSGSEAITVDMKIYPSGTVLSSVVMNSSNKPIAVKDLSGSPVAVAGSSYIFARYVSGPYGKIGLYTYSITLARP
jgi:hypothetical protein